MVRFYSAGERIRPPRIVLEVLEGELILCRDLFIPQDQKTVGPAI